MDWQRVEKLRAKGASWEVISRDPKVGFAPPEGSDPARPLKALYLQRRSRSQRHASSHAPAPRPGIPPARAFVGRHARSLAVLLALALVVGGLAVWLATPRSGSGYPEVVTYCGGEGSAEHYHPLLIIQVNGVQQHLPYDPSQSADIGYLPDPTYTNPDLYCAGGGIHALHTHDGSGIVHCELPPGITGPTLGDFFTIWGQPLGPRGVWSYQGTVTVQMHDMDTGATTDFSSDPAALPLYVPPQGPTANPYPIPQGLIFQGAYGTGESGGMFSGEIIWINVTTSGASSSHEVQGGACALMAAGMSPLEPSGGTPLATGLRGL
jgi:hypothetical protein